MSRLNMLKVVETFNYPKDFHSSLYRLLFTLESPESVYYSPHAAQILRAILLDISRNGYKRSDEMNRLYVLFLGTYESLMVTLRSHMSSDSRDRFEENELWRYLGFPEDVKFSEKTMLKPITKYELGERAESLLYAREERKVIPIENYCPKFKLGSAGAKMLIDAIVKMYVASTTDEERRKNKLIFLKKRANDGTRGEDERLICEMLADSLENSSGSGKVRGGDLFNRLLREVSGNNPEHERIVGRIIKARNMAVHEGHAETDDVALANMISLLAVTVPAQRSDREARLDSEVIERKVADEVSKDLRSRKLSATFGKIFAGLVIAVAVWIGAIMIASVFAGKTDMEKLRWEPIEGQLDVRINEAIATKDTTQLLKIQRDLKWINDHLK